MDILNILVAVGLAVTVHCIDYREGLKVFPQPAPNFDIFSWGRGDWYSQARYVPCSFSGSREFTGIQFRNTLVGGIVKQFATWRVEGTCTTVPYRLDAVPNRNGVFILKDPIGDVMTGKQIMVIYNPRLGYNGIWGCTKIGIDGRCDDPWVTVTTRDRVPAPHVWESVARDLRGLWGITLRDMNIISHKNPCLPGKY